jgi:DNA invertase Pin-like site-specific DNA recombinase
MTLDPKIRPNHLRRAAVVYVRQSTLHQVRGNRESGDRQYALADRAKALGWSAASLQTIDEDQGRSGARAEQRQGFKKLLAEIGAGQVGLVLALEASRLARSSLDWHRLVEICVVTDTLLADETAVYNPRDPNDRLLLGVKGTLSEAELFTLRCRLHEGRWNKAKRGELANSLPVGYVRTEAGAVVKEPDRQVQARLSYVFKRFAELRVARRVLLQLQQEKLTVPTKVWGGPRHGTIRWKAPTLSDIMRLLHNPIYAGAYVYGQKEYDPFDRSQTNGKAKTKSRPPAEWPVCLRDVYPAYISWDQFTSNQQILHDNWFRHGSRGAPRNGRALLQGIVRCGRCGSRMSVFTYSTKEKRAPGYGCVAAYQNGAATTCQMMSSPWTSMKPTKPKRAGNGRCRSRERSTRSRSRAGATKRPIRLTDWWRLSWNRSGSRPCGTRTNCGAKRTSANVGRIRLWGLRTEPGYVNWPTSWAQSGMPRRPRWRTGRPYCGFWSNECTWTVLRNRGRSGLRWSGTQAHALA